MPVLHTAYQDLGEVLVGDVGQLLAVELGNYELCAGACELHQLAFENRRRKGVQHGHGLGG